MYILASVSPCPTHQASLEPGSSASAARRSGGGTQQALDLACAQRAQVAGQRAGPDWAVRCTGASPSGGPVRVRDAVWGEGGRRENVAGCW